MNRNLQPSPVIERVIPPPRLLLGSALLFWGAMTGRPLVGLIAALFVEGRHWIRMRWDFDDSSHERSWQLSFVLTAGTGVMIWLDDSRYTAVMVLASWLPVLLLPVQFVQTYGIRDSMDLSVFSLLAKRSRARNRRLGLLEDPVCFNFGNVLLVVILLASTVGVDSEKLFFLPGVVVLCVWALMARRRCRWPSLLIASLLACAFGYAGQAGLERIEKLLRRGEGDASEEFDPRFHTTMIGSRARVSLSPEIIWRLKAEGSPLPPRLLRTATYSNFLGSSWQNGRIKFEELDPLVASDGTYHPFLEGLGEPGLRGLRAYQLRGGVRERFPLPLVGNAVAVRGLEDHEVEAGNFGMVRVIPKKPVIDCAVVWRMDASIELPPDRTDVMKLSAPDLMALRGINRELGLDKVPALEQRLAILKQWFQHEFRYTLDLTIRQPTHKERTGPAPMPSAIVQFLTQVRAGHCEYFATAATLLLRESGVPCRYAIGYAVAEKDERRGDYVIRGTHGHAWCRVWDEQNQRWIDFDPTPTDWGMGFAQKQGWGQIVKDWIKRVREDFYLWRTDPDHEMGVMVVMSCLGLSLSVFVVRRLWRSRHQVADGSLVSSYSGEVLRTSLNRLERLAGRVLGPRPSGQPLVQWLGGLERHIGRDATLLELLALHQRLRFDPQPPEPCQVERLQELSEWLEQRLREHQRE